MFVLLLFGISFRLILFLALSFFFTIFLLLVFVLICILLRKVIVKINSFLVFELNFDLFVLLFFLSPSVFFLLLIAVAKPEQSTCIYFSLGICRISFLMYQLQMCLQFTFGLKCDVAFLFTLVIGASVMCFRKMFLQRFVSLIEHILVVVAAQVTI